MTGVGTVREWHEELGWGVIDSPDTPGGCWAHFSHVAVPGYRSLQPGQAVTLEWTSHGQDGFAYRAVRVWPAAEDPEQGEREGPAGAYTSLLQISFDEPDGNA